MDISEIRYLRAKQLLQEEANDNQAVFAERIDRSAGQVNHLLKENPIKGIGNTLARHIEECFGKEKWWLDKPYEKGANNSPKHKKDRLHLHERLEKLSDEGLRLFELMISIAENETQIRETLAQTSKSKNPSKRTKTSV